MNGNPLGLLRCNISLIAAIAASCSSLYPLFSLFHASAGSVIPIIKVLASSGILALSVASSSTGISWLALISSLNVLYLKKWGTLFFRSLLLDFRTRFCCYIIFCSLYLPHLRFSALRSWARRTIVICFDILLAACIASACPCPISEIQ